MIKHINFFFVWYWLSYTLKLDKATTTFVTSISYYFLTKYNNTTTINRRPIIESSLLLLDTFFESTIFFQIFLFLRVAESINYNYDNIIMLYTHRDVIIDPIKSLISISPPKKRKRKAFN
jgi:hypothetical protein